MLILKKLGLFGLGLFLVGCFGNFSFARENIDPNALWQKAVLIAGLNQNLVPGVMESRMEELDAKDQVVKSEESLLRTYLDDRGEVQIKVVKAFANGEDITAARQRAMEKERQVNHNKRDSANQRNVSFSLDDSNPFKPEVQGEVVYKFLRLEDRNQMVGAVYQFSLKQKQGLIRGTAWLDWKTGVPVSICFAPDPLPAFVSRLENTVNYEYVSNGFWYPKELVMTGAGGVLLIRKKMRMRMLFRDYWNHPQP